MTAGWKNRLYFGDNLEILRKEIPSESLDLVYLDPPFNSNATYNVLFAEKSGEKSAAHIAAFDDTWHWGLESVGIAAMRRLSVVSGIEAPLRNCTGPRLLAGERAGVF